METDNNGTDDPWARARSFAVHTEMRQQSPHSHSRINIDDLNVNQKNTLNAKSAENYPTSLTLGDWRFAREENATAVDVVVKLLNEAAGERCRTDKSSDHTHILQAKLDAAKTALRSSFI